MASDEAVLLVRIEAQMRQFERAMEKASGTANTTAGRIEKRFRAMDRNLSVIGAGLGRSLLGPLAAGAGIREIAAFADAWNRVGRSLETTKDFFGVQVRSQEQLAEMAVRTRSALEPLATLYTRTAQATRGLGFSEEEVALAAETVAKALKLGSASAEEQASVLTQLSQALQKGKLDGDEFRSVMENAGVIQLALAKRLGVSTGALQDMSKNGLLRVNDLMGALLDIAPEVNKAFEGTAATIGEAFTNLRTEITQVIGQLDDVYDVSGTLTGQITLLARQIALLGDSFGTAAQFIADIDSKFRSFINTINDYATAAGRFTGEAAIGEFLGLSDDDLMRIRDASDAAAAMRRDLELTAALRKKAAAQGDLIAGPPNLPDNTPPPPPPKKPPAHKKTPEEKFAEDIAGIRARAAALIIETGVVGKNTFEQERALAIHDLLNEAKRAGLKITPDIRKAIEEEATAYALAADALERTEDRFRAINDLALEFGGQAIDAFESLLDGTKSLNESLSDSVKIIRRMVLEALLLGQGPLANLFGTGGFGGGVGGGIGAIIGGLFGGAAPVGAAAPARFAAMALPTAGGMRTARMAGGQAPAVVHLMVDENQMFASRVVGISGAVAVQTVRANNKGIPGLLANQRARGLA